MFSVGDHFADLQSLDSGKDTDQHNQSNHGIDYSLCHRRMLFIGEFRESAIQRFEKVGSSNLTIDFFVSTLNILIIKGSPRH